ncbi:MAG: hypothetical protein H6703_08200 [Myxococcales bacterium]|nr:hypothetical protein [Myxococcales bacterium]MCB9551380.1 hypothetical protein [Myxococcales bacterium]
MAALAAALLGCGASNPRPDPLAAWPERAWLRAEGHGPTAAAAADDARARLAAQIRARLSARLTIESTETSTGGDERIERQIVTEASFERAELIAVPNALRGCAPGDCVAVAVLNRARASDALRDAAAGPSARLRAAVEQAATAELAAFTRAVRDAGDAWAELAPIGWQRAAIEDGLPADFAADRAAWRRLDAERARRLAALRVAVAPVAGVEAPWPDRITDALVAAFGRHGISAARGEGCADLVARPEASLSCGRGPLGPRCALTLRVALAPCEGPSLVVVDFADAGLAAVAPRDPARAEAALAARVDGARLADPLGRALAPVLPIEAPR